MNNSRSWAQRSWCYEILCVMVDMNNSMLWVKGSWCYEQFRDMDDMNDFVWWAQGSRCYEQFKVVDDMNESGFREINPLNVINSLGLLVIWMIHGPEQKAPNVMNNSGLWMIWMTQGCELKALDVMNNSDLWMTGTTPGGKLRALDAMNNSRPWLICTPWTNGFVCYELRWVVDDMNDLRSCKLNPLGPISSYWLWMIWTILFHEPKSLNVMNN